MATEEGTIVRIAGAVAWVKTKKSTACESCASRKSCNVMGGGDEMEVEADNEAGAAVGDTVIMKFDTSPLLKATFLLYVFPILCMLGGAVIGQETASRFGLPPSGFSAVVGFAFLAVSILFVRSKGNRMAQKKEYRPRIIRVKRHSPADSPR